MSAAPSTLSAAQAEFSTGYLRPTSSTSAQALAAIGNKALAASCTRLLDICIAGQRNGAVDFSSREIQSLYEAQFSQRIEAGTISARVNELVASKRLVRSLVSRPCVVTGRPVHAVFAPATQVRLTR